ncbi:MAG: PEP-CTERM sorting domain-containing protein [Verrucomicrobiales bacterium]
MTLKITPASLALISAISLIHSSQAAIILASDFTDSTATPRANAVAGAAANGLSAGTVSDITWTTNGVTDPGDVGVTIITGNNPENYLFTSADTDDHIAVDNNVGNGGSWYASIYTTLDGNDISLTDTVIDFSNFSNAGNFQTQNRDITWSVEIFDGSGSSLGSSSIVSPIAITGTATATFSSPITLTGTDTFEFRVTAAKGTLAGVNTGIDAITFNGDIVPEPSAALLLGLGALTLGSRRRR